MSDQRDNTADVVNDFVEIKKAEHDAATGHDLEIVDTLEHRVPDFRDKARDIILDHRIARMTR